MAKRSFEEGESVFAETKRTKIDGSDISEVSLVEKLPSDLIVEVVSRVASSSIVDLFRIKLCCRTLEQIGKENYVTQKIDIENFDLWRVRCNHKDTALAYSQLCADSDNPGALFLQGMKQYCRDLKAEEGMKSLEKAAKLGHKTSSYALGLILLCCGGSESEKEKGMELIRGVGKEIVYCRRRLRKLVECEMWVHSEFVKQCKAVRFDKEDHRKCSRKSGWSAGSYLSEDDEGEGVFCEACVWEFEYRFFLHLFSLPKPV